MSKINEKCREIMDASEWVAIATGGEKNAHLVATWTKYTVQLGSDSDYIYAPAGVFSKTESNLALNNRVQLMYASESVAGQYSPGNGCRIIGTGEILTSGAKVEQAKELFPWARGVLKVRVESCKALL